jgi:hypothetical protein
MSELFLLDKLFTSTVTKPSTIMRSTTRCVMETKGLNFLHFFLILMK